MILKSLKVYSDPKILVIALLGFASGLPFPLTFATLSFWLAEEGIQKSSIGLFALVGTPFVIKFLWAPLVDHLSLPFLTKALGRRRSWVLFSQLAIILSLVVLGAADPVKNLWGMALVALVVSICSATQDIGIDAFRIEAVKEDQQGAAAAAIVFGWRIGALVSGAGSLFLASAFGWFISYCVMALLMLPGIIAVLFASEPKTGVRIKETQWLKWLKIAVVEPFVQFASRDGWMIILLFIILYKFGDAIALSMLGPFAVELGFSKDEYAAIVKVFGTAATLLGAFAGGVITYRYGIIKGLWIGGILQMVAILIFVLQAQVGHNNLMLTVSISVENFTSGMGTTAFVAYLSSLCHAKFTATQYALFSALAATGRTWFSSISGYMAEWLGWSGFFIASTLLAIPGLLLLILITRQKGK